MKHHRPPLSLPQYRHVRPRVDNCRHGLPELPTISQERRISQDGPNLTVEEHFVLKVYILRYQILCILARYNYEMHFTGISRFRLEVTPHPTSAFNPLAHLYGEPEAIFLGLSRSEDNLERLRLVPEEEARQRRHPDYS